MGLDRPDVQFVAKEGCRCMSRPTTKDLKRVKRLVRYLINVPEVVFEFDSECKQEFIDVYVDADWAGCKQSRRSTSGGMIIFGGTVVKSWSSTQPTPALSSGESEYISLVKGACEGLGVQALLLDMGIEAKVRVHVDSTVAKSIAGKTGLGRIRHMDVRILWLQDACREGRVNIFKVCGLKNPADVLTKPVPLARAAALLSSVGVRMVLSGHSRFAVSEGGC